MKPLVAFAQISDPHICDAQSPLRASYFDKLSDPHHPVSSLLPGPLGGYRAQEALTTQVFESMLRTLNQLEAAPLSGQPIELLLLTGDLADNMQLNELTWVSRLLSGGEVTPNSGSSSSWQGPGSLEHYSPHYWNPDSTPLGEAADSPSARYEFPKVAELWALATRAFRGEGSRLPRVAVHGNHDGLIQGTIAATLETRSVATGSQLSVDFPSEAQALQFLSSFGPKGPAAWPPQELQIFESTQADHSRDLATSDTWGQLALSSTPQKYWRRELSQFVLIGLDTCNPWGGWDGSIDVQQFEWLRQTLARDAERKVIIVSHHPQSRLENDWGGPAGEARVGGNLILQTLNEHGKVLAWVAGHTHRHFVTRLPSPDSMGILSIETASLIDWPQQCRILEIFEDPQGELYLASTAINHMGDVAPVARPSEQITAPNPHSADHIHWLAGLSRQLAANDWQRQHGTYSVDNLEGTHSSRNFVVRL